MLLTLGWNQYVIGVLMVLFLVICALVILTILVQRPQGGGLAGAFGGGSGSGQTAFGTKTGDALTLLTIGMFVVYLLAAILLNYGIKANAHPPTAPEAVSTDAPQSDSSSTPAAPANGTPTTDAPATGTPAPTATPAAPAPADSATPPATPAPSETAPATPPAPPADSAKPATPN